MVTSLTDVCVLVACRTERDSRRCMVTSLTDVCVLVAYRTERERDSRRCMVTSLTDVCVWLHTGLRETVVDVW